jgi:hypothetical protein
MNYLVLNKLTNQRLIMTGGAMQMLKPQIDNEEKRIAERQKFIAHGNPHASPIVKSIDIEILCEVPESTTADKIALLTTKDAKGNYGLDALTTDSTTDSTTATETNTKFKPKSK